MIKSSPNILIAEHTDWRFLNEAKGLNGAIGGF
jgi:hypothetical protein